MKRFNSDDLHRLVELLSYDERRILVMLLTESWATPSAIARKLGMNRQTVWYAVKRLREEGFVGAPMIYVRPDLPGLYYAFFYSESEPKDYTVLKFETLEGHYIFGVPFQTFDELEALSAKYGKPWLVPGLAPKRLTPLQKEALRRLVSNPTISSTDLVEELGLPKTKARSLLAWARRNVNYTYWVNLEKAGIAALAVVSDLPPATTSKFFRCFAAAVGFYAAAFPDLGSASDYAKKVKAADPKARIYVLRHYELRPPPGI